MALQGHTGTLVERHPNGFLENPVQQFRKAVAVHGARTEALLVAHTVKVNGVPLPPYVSANIQLIHPHARLSMLSK